MPGFAPAAGVPAADSAANVVVSDVVGNKTDTVAGDSLVALSRILIGGPVVTYPVLAAGVTATAGAANTYGAYVELAAAGVITADAKLASVCLRTPSAAQTGKIDISYDTGGTPVLLAEVDYEIATDAAGYFSINLCGMGGIVPAGNNIGVRIKTTAGAQTVDASVGFMLLA